MEEDKSLSLGERMKKYEEIHDASISNDEYIVFRLDGCSFSKFTNAVCKQPFDENFTDAMVLTVNDLIIKFNCVVGYTHSDEITLVIKPHKNEEKNEYYPHIYSGRIQKLTSIFASTATIRFNYHFMSLINKNKEKYSEKAINIANSYTACFDCRSLSFKEELRYEIMNHFKWRSDYDCKRNCIQSYAREIFSNKQLHKKNITQQINMMEKEGFDTSCIPTFLMYGTYSKIYTDDTKRTKVYNFCIRIKSDDEFWKLLIEDKYLDRNDTHIICEYLLS